MRLAQPPLSSPCPSLTHWYPEHLPAVTATCHLLFCAGLPAAWSVGAPRFTDGKTDAGRAGSGPGAQFLPNGPRLTGRRPRSHPWRKTISPMERPSLSAFLLPVLKPTSNVNMSINPSPPGSLSYPRARGTQEAGLGSLGCHGPHKQVPLGSWAAMQPAPMDLCGCSVPS